MTDSEIKHEERRVMEFDHNAYATVSRNAELQEIKLIASSYVVKPEAFTLQDSIADHKKSFIGKCNDFIFDEGEGFAWGKMQWIAEIKSGRKAYLKLSAEYLLLYSGVKECDSDHIELYFRKIGRFATYPYFRSLFSMQTGESGLSLPPLPSLKERID